MQGIDKGTAQRILTIWKQSGADSPEALRRLFLRRSFSRSQQIGLQLLIDAASGAGAFYAARVGTWVGGWVEGRGGEKGNLRVTFECGREPPGSGRERGATLLALLCPLVAASVSSWPEQGAQAACQQGTPPCHSMERCSPTPCDPLLLFCR